MSDLRRYLLAGQNILGGTYVPEFSEIAAAAAREFQRRDLEDVSSLEQFRITYAYLDACNGVNTGVDPQRAFSRHFADEGTVERARGFAAATIERLLELSRPTKPI